MESIKSTNSLPNSLRQNWDYVKKIDDQVKATEAIGGTLADRIKLSTKYRAQSQAIQHGAQAVLKGRWDADLFKGNLARYGKLNDLASKAASGASAVTYESLINHIRSGGAINAFDWKGLLKGRAWSHVDHATCVTEGSTKALGRALAANFAKVMILMHVFKGVKTSYNNARNNGENVISSGCKAAGTAVKELGKSMISWEAGAFGGALAAVFFPGLGLIGALVGGILVGGTVGFLLEKYMPAPVKQEVAIRHNDQANPFV